VNFVKNSQLPTRKFKLPCANS